MLPALRVEQVLQRMHMRTCGHTVAASATHGRSLHGLRLQPAQPTVAACTAHGCRLRLRTGQQKAMWRLRPLSLSSRRHEGHCKLRRAPRRSSLAPG